ncbi:MAG: T9SS type A sorting domain-containing protein [Bacteroidales bacterium]|nr:T9SS type A sorting domain-containing protein [Bacteroidales bacterium]MCF8386463.1 T9SS type A sorting domain-containing protein [Bacteroidales bacterium]MCF8397793.1 T9SS type A sorting domain-containing protein [Bacteroidales bacterium]
MKIIRIITTVLLLVFSSGLIFSQGVGIGHWRDHLPYNKSVAVAKMDKRVYCATPYDLFYFNTSDNSINRLSKINGLTDFGISTIEYNKELDILLVAYKNANIDLVKNGNIINIPDIKRANLFGNKTINRVLFIDQFAYLSCGFGIVVLDLDREEIKDTYYIGPDGTQINITDFAANDTSFFASTETGIYTAYRDEPNLANFANWSKISHTPHNNTKVDQLEFFQENLLVNFVFNDGDKDTLFRFGGNTWNYLDTVNIDKVRNINIENSKLIISDDIYVKIFKEDFSFDKELTSYYVGMANLEYVSPHPAEVIMDEKGDYWIADRNHGLLHIFDNAQFARVFEPEGPPSINSFDMTGAGEAIWITPGGKTDVWSAVYNREGIFVFEDEDWKVFNSYNTTGLQGMHDFIVLAANPLNPDQVFAGAFRNEFGIAEFNKQELVNMYNDTNSSIQKWEAANSIAITGMDFDQNGNLWVANSGASDILSVRKEDGSKDGEWHSFNLGSSLSSVDVGSLTVDTYNQKWIIKRKTIESSLFAAVFTENGTFSNTADDEVQNITANPGSGNIPGNKLYCLTPDQDGEIWIGTDDGIAVIYTPENIFRGGNFDAQRIIIPRNDGSGLGDILLENEVITCITVDGDNNKWIGTDNAGVFLVSEDGMEEIYHFSAEDSPLFADLINDIAINEEGEVFIGTANGIISFRAESAPAQPVLNDVYAYPNPVHSSFTGKIGIKGLVKDADVKITDISGNLVYKTRSQGGQAVWDGNNFEGKRARTGVYLVFITNEDGSETEVTKILFVN